VSQNEKLPALNTDRELWREKPGDYYSDSIHVTEGGGIGLNCDGCVIVMPIRKWHALVEAAQVTPPPSLIDKLNKAKWDFTREERHEVNLMLDAYQKKIASGGEPAEREQNKAGHQHGDVSTTPPLSNEPLAKAEAAPDSVGLPQCPICWSKRKLAWLCRYHLADGTHDPAPHECESCEHSWHDSVGEAPPQAKWPWCYACHTDPCSCNPPVGEAPAAQKETAQTQSGIMPLTYEQEVHSILWAAAAITGDLILCFKAQAARETGETKKLTQKCIAWREDDLRRIKALIPQALERRDAAPAQSLYEAPPTVADALRLLRKIEACSGDAAKLILLKHFREAGRQEGWEARRDADIQLVTELCFMAGVKKVIIGNEDLLRRIRALTPSPEPAQKGKA
jgi:hypothetical protein